MKSILKYLSPLCPCPLSLFLCRSFLSILKSTQPCFWGLLQALSCPSHPQSVVPNGMFTPCPSQQVFNLWRVFHCQVAALGAFCCQPTLCSWSSVLCWLGHSQPRNLHPLLTEPCPPQLLSPWPWVLRNHLAQSHSKGWGRFGWVLPGYLPSLPCFLLAAGEFLLSWGWNPSMADWPHKTVNTECTSPLSSAELGCLYVREFSISKVKNPSVFACLVPEIKNFGQVFMLLIHFMLGWHCTNSSSCVWFPFFFWITFL